MSSSYMLQTARSAAAASADLPVDALMFDLWSARHDPNRAHRWKQVLGHELELPWQMTASELKVFRILFCTSSAAVSI